MVDYLNFDKVLDELQLDEEELKRMVSEGQIRAYRDEDRMKFRQDDIQTLKGGQLSEPTIILPSAGSIGSVLDDEDDMLLVEDEQDTGDTLLDFDDEGSADVDDFASADATVVPTLDFDLDGGTETVTEELVFDGDDDDLALSDESVGALPTQRIESQATFIDDESESPGTQPLGFTDDVGATMIDDGPPDLPGEAMEDEIGATLVDADAPPASRTSRAGKKSSMISGRSSERTSARAAPAEAAPQIIVEETAPIGLFATIFMILSFLLLFYGGFVVFDMVNHQPSAASDSVAGWMSESFLDLKYKDPGNAGKSLSQPVRANAVPTAPLPAEENGGS